MLKFPILNNYYGKHKKIIIKRIENTFFDLIKKLNEKTVARREGDGKKGNKKHY